jgi:hypothetical protein
MDTANGWAGFVVQVRQVYTGRRNPTKQPQLPAIIVQTSHYVTLRLNIPQTIELYNNYIKTMCDQVCAAPALRSVTQGPGYLVLRICF